MVDEIWGEQKMKQQQFIEALINEGYKQISHHDSGCVLHIRFKLRNSEVTIQDFNNYTNIYYKKQLKKSSIQYVQHRITNYAKALKNIKKLKQTVERGIKSETNRGTGIYHQSG
jgi:hypothetical protein